MASALKGGGTSPHGAAQVKSLYSDPYIMMSLDPSKKIIRFVRSAVPFPDLETPKRTYETLIAILDEIGRQNYGLLTDLRAAPGRNDPAFESLMLSLRTRVQVGFARRGTLVATAVGAMQVRRLSKDDGLERLISNDEDEILRYLCGAPD